jgi:hypothetical protein
MRAVIKTGDAVRSIRATTRRELLLETLALRHQLGVLARSNGRFRPADRLFWLFLAWFWPRWREALVLIQPSSHCAVPWPDPHVVRYSVERRAWRRPRRHAAHGRTRAEADRQTARNCRPLDALMWETMLIFEKARKSPRSSSWGETVRPVVRGTRSRLLAGWPLPLDQSVGCQFLGDFAPNENAQGRRL